MDRGPRRVFRDDTFFQLSDLGQIGTAAISVVLCVIMLWLCWRVVRREPLWLRLVLALVLFLLFEWLSPQIYYFWYMVVYPGLSLQWVVGFWPRPPDVLSTLALQRSDTLSGLSRALLGWGMIGLALLARGRRQSGPGAKSGPWAD